MSVEKYSKTVRNFTIPEICVYGLAHKIVGLEIKDRVRDAIAKVLNKEPNFLDEPDRVYYFTKSKNGKKYTFVSDPENTTSYPIKTLPATQQINIEEIKTSFAESQSQDSLELEEPAPEIKTEEENADPVPRPSSTDEVENLRALVAALTSNVHVAETTTKSKSLNFRPKIKYEPTHGIEAFIRSVECYGDANDITDRKKWIAIAKTALNASEDGLLLQDALLPAEEEDWDLFKNKLLSILGNPPDYYRDVYRSFRRGTEKPGLAMSKLTQAYKRGFLTNGQNLTESDKAHIMHQFINSLANPLRGLVKAEEKRLTFSKIADRVAELERCFGPGFAPQSAASLMYPEARVQMVKAQKEEQTQNTVQLKMIELINSLMAQSKTQHAQMMKSIESSKSGPRQNSDRDSKPRTSRRINSSKLRGHCIRWVRDGHCRFENNCKYKHETDVPKEIKDLFSQ